MSGQLIFANIMIIVSAFLMIISFVFLKKALKYARKYYKMLAKMRMDMEGG